MRNRRIVPGLTIVISLLVGSVALPAARTDAVNSNAATARSADLNKPLTIQRLLLERLQWALRLSRSLGTLDGVEPEQYGTQSIVDEPDPTGVKPPTDPELPGTPEPVERNEDENDESSQQELRELG